MMVESPSLFGRHLTRIHCVGVGGMGLGPLAIYLSGLGIQVSGEDDAMTEAMRIQLLRAGVRIESMGRDCELIVCSSAISPAHSAARFAAEQQIQTVRRGEMLAELCKGKKLVAICGAHGKTSTTAMLITALRASGFPFGYVLGGLFANEAIAPAKVDAGDWIVAEIDESDGTIGCFSPEICVPTNLDWDHPDFYPTADSLSRAFQALFARTRGTVLYNTSCEMSAGLASYAKRPRSIGEAGDFSFRLLSEDSEGLRLQLSGGYGIETVFVRARGVFNAANAAAALAAAKLMGASLSTDLLADYPSVRRRQGVLHKDEMLTVVEDYAHHPAEISALLKSLRAQVGERGRLVAVFQPHRYSRTLQFRDEFVKALLLADEIHLLEVYPAGESPLPGSSSRDLYEAIPAGERAKAHYHGNNPDQCFGAVQEHLKPGDWLAIVGAGDVDQMARRWLAALGWKSFAMILRAGVSTYCGVTTEAPLAPRTTLRVGGAARVLAEPASIEDLRSLLAEARGHSVPWYLLGRGSNVLVPDEGVDGLVICLTHPVWSQFEKREQGRLWVGAGLRLKQLCGLASKEGLKGFEFLEGIPGTVGGALRMNAGAMNAWIFDVVEEVQILTPEGELQNLRREQMSCDYRRCAELERAIALGALLRGTAGAPLSEINRKLEEYRARRQETQPREPSAGCMFKNPPGDSAGRLIEHCGLKGLNIGDAEVSTVHANFIINRGSASAADIIRLVRDVRTRVRDASGVLLEPEVLLLGKPWSSVL